MQVQKLRLTGAIVVAGAIVTAGRRIEVTPSEARDLIRRGKAVPDPTDEPADAVSALASAGSAGGNLHPVIAQHQQDEADREARSAMQTGATSAASFASGDGAGDALPPADDTEKTGEPVTVIEAPTAQPPRRGRPPKAQS